MKFQLGSVVNTRPFSCLPYTFSIDWAPEFEARAERSCQTLPLEGLAPKETVCLVSTGQALASWAAWLCPIPSDKMRESRDASRRRWRKGKHRRKVESVWRQTWQLSNSISSLSPEAMDFFSLFCPWPQRGHGFNHYAIQASQELWFYGAFTMHQMWSWPPTCLSSCAWHKGAFQGCEWGWQPAKLCLPSPGHEA